MFVFDNGVFTDSPELEKIYQRIVTEASSKNGDKTNERDTLNALGYMRVDDYYHKDNLENAGIEVNIRTSNNLSLNRNYEFFIEWYYAGLCTGVFVKDIIGLQDFLSKYLPVVTNIGELKTIWKASHE